MKRNLGVREIRKDLREEERKGASGLVGAEIHGKIESKTCSLQWLRPLKIHSLIFNVRLFILLGYKPLSLPQTF